ncbi:MAG: double-strand break repair helicase AddA, partial [Dongiaceae bacterium]
MSAAPRPDPAGEAARAQLRAADPQASVWVAASAGTGKTKVLTDRVLSLLLSGTDPGRILCLTFTKAAAAEMANRVAERLAAWAAADDAKLDEALCELTGRDPDDERRRLARRLFARVLDTPGGMKIQTLHAFCQSLLRRFPLEAAIAPHFEVLDERSAAELMTDAREAVLGRARDGDDAALAAALAGVTAQVAEPEFAELMRALTLERGRIERLLARPGGVAGVVAAVRRLLGVAPGETAESVREAACADAALDLLGLRLAVAALGQGTKTDKARGGAIAAWLAEPALRQAQGRVARFDDYRRCFLTKDGAVLDRLATKQPAAVPGVIEVLGSEAERLIAVGERLNAATIAEATAALLGLGAALLGTYERHKTARARLDYDDLVLAALALLERPDMAPWVLFKLDGGLDHILIDEAQDTNPEQWQIVAALAEEFFAGAGARDAVRTVFAVGDAKQSIFSFQRADPAGFERMRAHFKDRVTRIDGRWDEVPLNVSFRSTPAVLAAVDAVFARDTARDGVALDGQPIVHRPDRAGQAGLVELWPPVGPRPVDEPAPWTPPTERRAADSPHGRLARLIAGRIAAMVGGGEHLASRDRPVRPGDVMVLVRRRTAFLEELVRELKQRGVPVAGVDRMVLTDQIAVMDLVALGQFLLLPEDDLTLATVLRGPLVGLGEDALFDLAQPRGDRRLWHELRRRRGDNAAFAGADELLAGLLARADFVPPYELYADLLGRLGGRRALLARLGPEAADPIDEFMNLALGYERGHAPSLQGFLHWLAAGAVEVKRELDQDGGGRVRVMTVHGAKGLQAPIVFLPDTMQTPQHPARLLWHEDRAERAPALPLWSPRVACDEARAAAAREHHRRADRREYRRLLYVALTRAEDRLYVCGWHGRKAPPDDCWYKLIERGLADAGEAFDFECMDELGTDGWAGAGRRLANPQTAKPRAEEEAARAAAIESPLPGWAVRAPEPEPSPARPLAPSR